MSTSTFRNLIHNFKRAASIVSAALLAALALATPGTVPVQASSTQSNPSSAASASLPSVDCHLPINYPQPDCREAIAQALAQRNNEMATDAARSNVLKPWQQDAPTPAKPIAARPNKAPNNPPTDCNGVSEIPTIECQGLLALYASTSGASWTDNSGWNTTTPCSTPWYGVTCTSGHVTKLFMVGNNLVGTIPAATMADLTFLQELDLHSNALTGGIPALPSTLTYLSLDRNSLSGTIPTVPAGLYWLSVENNQLTGSIPTLPTGLHYVLLSNNNLSGSIPALPSTLVVFVADGDNLTGTIPTLPNGMTNFEVGYSVGFLTMRHNNLTGTIPALPSTVTYVDVSANNLTGPIPTLPAGLTYLNAGSMCAFLGACYHNSLSGSIPALSGLTSLTYLDLDRNLLTGAISALPTSLQSLFLSHNSLSGSIPTLPNSLTDVEFQYNFLSGAIPALPNGLITLYLNNNAISGTIPALPPPLSYLDLSNNQLSGAIPALSGTALYNLYLNNNALTGAIPALPTSLNSFDASRNKLSGAIPALPANLNYLNLFDNQLIGAMPDLPAAMSALYLNSNQLTGLIPISITSTNIPAYATYNTQNLTLCGGQNALMPASSFVNTFIGARIPPWTGQCNPSPIESIGVFRGNNFYLRNNNTTGYADITVTFNLAGTHAYPVVGDWTGGGFDTIGVFDQSNGLFSLCKVNDTASCANSSNILQLVLGYPNDQPMAGRWTTTATHDGVGVFRPSNGLIYLRSSLSTGYADYTMVLGIPGDVGLAGDWNGDGNDSLGVYRPSTQVFYLSNALCNCSAYGDYSAQLGIPGDVPLAGDWPAQGFGGIGVFRPGNGLIYLKNRLTTGFADTSLVFGIPNDIPLAGHWARTGSIPLPPPQVIVAPGSGQPSISTPGNNGLGD